MKKTITLLLLSILFATVNTLAQSSNEKFNALLKEFGEPMLPPQSIGSYQLYENRTKTITNELAWEFLWQKNPYTKLEETNCHPGGYYIVPDKDLVVLFFYKGTADALFYFVDIQTYSLKKGKLKDELYMVAGFAKENSACNIYVQNKNLVKFTTLAGTQTVIDVEISDKGKIKR